MAVTIPGTEAAQTQAGKSCAACENIVAQRPEAALPCDPALASHPLCSQKQRLCWGPQKWSPAPGTVSAPPSALLVLAVLEPYPGREPSGYLLLAATCFKGRHAAAVRASLVPLVVYALGQNQAD